MAEVVDSIVAELVIRGIEQYEANYKRATKAADEHAAAYKRLAAAMKLSAEMMATPAARGTRGTAERQEADQAVADVKRAAKDKADAEKAAAKEAATAVRAAEREKSSEIRATARAAEKAATDRVAAERAASEAVIAAAEREAAARARLSEVAQRAVDRRAAQVQPATSSRIGATVPREQTGTRSIPASVIAGGATEEVAAEAEINHLVVDRIVKQAALNTLQGAEKREIQDQLALLMLRSRLLAQNVSEEEVLLRVESLRTAQAARANLEERAAAAKGGGSLKGVGRFAEAATLGRTGGSGAAIAGLGVAAAAYEGVRAVSSSLDYAKQISDTSKSTGVSTTQLQVYQTAARSVGATNEQLSSSFGRLNDYVGRAKEGDKEAAKTFAALGINIKSVGSAGDALPTLLNRLAQIKDPAERAAVGTRLFGEEYRRLDGVLGQGTSKIDALAASLEKAGGILSESDIKRLDDADRTLGELKNTLTVDLAKVVAGNAEAILGLANAFFKAADGALAFAAAKDRAGDIGVLDRSRNTFNQDRTDQIGNLLTQGDGSLQHARSQAFARQLETHDGRQALFDLNRSEARDLASRASLGPDGKDRLDVDRARNSDERTQILRSERKYRDGIRNPPKAQPGAVNQAALGSLFAPNPPKGKSAASLAAEAEARTKRYLDQLSGLEEAELRGQEALTGSIDKRAKIENKLADRALAKQLGDIESERKSNVDHGADPKLEAQRAKTLSDAARVASATAKAGIAQETQVALINAANQHLQTSLSIDAEIINTQASLAGTRKERLALELRALDNQKAQEAANLRTTIATLKPGDPARAEAQRRLGSLDRIYAGRADQTRDGALSPLDAYRKQLKGAVGDTSEALEQVKVNALSRIDDQLSSTIGKVLGLRGAFGELAASIIQDLAKIEIEKAILGATGGSSGGGIGGFLAGLIGGGSNSGALGSSASAGALSGSSDFISAFDAGLPGFATGGSATIGGNPGIDQNILSINGKPSLRVGRGETLTVSPNLGPINQRVTPAPQGGGQITVHVQANDYFDARVAHVSGPIAQNTSIKVVRAAAPSIAQAGASASPSVVRRVQTLGS